MAKWLESWCGNQINPDVDSPSYSGVVLGRIFRDSAGSVFRTISRYKAFQVFGIKSRSLQLKEKMVARKACVQEIFGSNPNAHMSEAHLYEFIRVCLTRMSSYELEVRESNINPQIAGGSGAVKPTGPLATLQRSQHSSCDGDEGIQENDAICLLCRLAFRFVENVIKIECWCKKTVVAHEAWASNTSVINCNKCGQSYNHAPAHLVRVAVRAKVWSAKGGLVDDICSDQIGSVSFRIDLSTIKYIL
ncbi:hypothetical protein LguiB_026534 [Lonicera macranthoides]